MKWLLVSMVLAGQLLDAGAGLDAGLRDAGWPSDAGQGSEPPPSSRKKLFVVQRKVDERLVQEVLAQLDTRARVGQLLMAYPQIDKTKPVEVGGVLFVGNLLRKPEQAKARIEWSKANALVPPFFAIDMEGGPSNRMKKVPSLASLPSAKEMAALPDDEVERWGEKVGEAMASVGLNMNLAPVLDTAETGHMARNARSFSGKRDVVAKKATAYAQGLLRSDVVPIGKHFPGYGDIEGDSDHALVTTDWPAERVFEEISTFEKLPGLLGGVMLANVIYPSIENTPAILSPKLVEEAHRRGWLTITDDLSIQLLADSIGGTPEDVLVRAFLAGNDVLLTTAPPDWAKGLDYLGILTRTAEASPENQAILTAACTRVLRLKEQMGLLDQVPIAKVAK